MASQLATGWFLDSHAYSRYDIISVTGCLSSNEPFVLVLATNMDAGVAVSIHSSRNLPIQGARYPHLVRSINTKARLNTDEHNIPTPGALPTLQATVASECPTS